MRLNLVLFRDGRPVAESISAIDTIQYLHLTNLTAGLYQLNVERLSVPTAGASEPYGVAWYSSARWTNAPPTVTFLGATLAAGNMANVQFQLVAGQAGNFGLQSASSLTAPVVWTAPAGVGWTQTGPNTFQAPVPVEPSGPRFFRVVALPR